jgi:hypothetical protein
MIIEPYIGAGSIKFGASEVNVIAQCGVPIRSALNRFDENVLDYDERTITIAQNGVVEIGFVPQQGITLRGLDLFNDKKAFLELCLQDGQALEFVGFVILPRFGVTFTGFHAGPEEDKAVTVFARGRWDRFRADARPFRLKNR